MYRGWKNISLIENKSTAPKTTVSIIIAVRNEEDNIARTLDCLIKQDYPEKLREVIVVDDHSTDNTAAIVRSYAKRGISLIQLNEKEPLNSYKKLAISTAIQRARGDVIVTTDGDCRMGEHWLSTIMSFFASEECYMLSSPVLYSEEKSFFERLQTLEFLYLIGLGASGIGNKKPTTCNGANLAYRKDVFYEMEGFKGIDELASGDDELLLHKVAVQNADKIYFCKSMDAAVYTDAKPTLSSFLNQRRRWASKSTKYKDKKVVALGVSIWFFNLCFVLVLFLLPFLNSGLLYTFLACLFGKLMIELLFVYSLTDFTGYNKYLPYLFILTFVHPFYLVGIGLLGNIGKYNWKGRMVR